MKTANGRGNRELRLAKVVAKHGWQTGAIKRFNQATGKKLDSTGRAFGRYYKRGEGYGFVQVDGVDYFLHAVNHCNLIHLSDESTLRPIIGDRVNVFADLSPEDIIIVLETGSVKEGRLEVTKWCFVRQLLDEEKFCASMPAWRITSKHWCNGRKKPERAKELWQGNKLKALVQFVTQNRSKLLDYTEVCGSNSWEHQFHLERLCPNEKWQELKLDDLPNELREIYDENGFGYKIGQPVVYAM